MPRYARIIDRGECYSTSKLVINGVPANKSAWSEFNFYPKDEMVGELLLVNGCNVLKITDDIYVQMSSAGIEEITEDEYKASDYYNSLGYFDANGNHLFANTDWQDEIYRTAVSTRSWM